MNHAAFTALSVHSFVHVLPKTTLSHSFTMLLGLCPRLHERLNLVCLCYSVFARYCIARENPAFDLLVSQPRGFLKQEQNYALRKTVRTMTSDVI